MPTRPVRLLLFADSHLGFDHPVRPRIARRRRGHDFLAHHRRVCRDALSERVDLLVHGGDLFHRPDVPASLVHQAFEPLAEVARGGIPVCLVPGNHERSRIPFDRFSRHPGVHVFRKPATTRRRVGGYVVAISGIPCVRHDARRDFPAALERSGWRHHPADLRLLVTHQAFEGAVVGPADFTFRRGRDVVRMTDVPPDFAAILSGHIHRAQVLETDLRRRPASAPVFYPGSIERTAFAERDEPKGYLILDLEPGAGGGAVTGWTFRHLEARPMIVRSLRTAGLTAHDLELELRATLAAVPPDAVLRLEADGAPEPEASHVLRAEAVRALAPGTMNVRVVVPGARREPGRPGRGSRDRRRGPPKPSTDPPEQASLF